MAGGWTSRHWPESHLTGITLLAATLIMAVPLWSVWAPAMPDYPAHLASFAMIQKGTDTALYHLHWSFVPNLASEVLVPRQTWKDPQAYDQKARQLAALFQSNFKAFASRVSEAVRQAGPV